MTRPRAKKPCFRQWVCGRIGRTFLTLRLYPQTQKRRQGEAALEMNGVLDSGILIEVLRADASLRLSDFGPIP